MTKRILGAVGIAATVQLIVYLMFSFANWSINPGDWEGSARTFAAFVSSILTIPALAVYFEVTA